MSEKMNVQGEEVDLSTIFGLECEHEGGVDFPEPVDAANLPFRHARKARIGLIEEKPWHRQAAFMVLSGMNHKEISVRLSKSLASVSIALQQPWVKELLAQESARTGRSEIDEFLNKEVGPSLEKLRELRDDSNISADVQRKAAVEILNRSFLGLPTQRDPSADRRDPNNLSDEELIEIINKRKN